MGKILNYTVQHDVFIAYLILIIDNCHASQSKTEIKILSM